MADFKRLHVWRKAHALALNAHRVSAGMRGTGSSVLRNQLIRAALSVPSNIVEGSAKHGDREFARFVKIALGSLSELEYHLIVANDMGWIRQTDFESLVDQLVDVRKMLTGFLKRLVEDASLSKKNRQQAANQQAAGSASMPDQAADAQPSAPGD